VAQFDVFDSPVRRHVMPYLVSLQATRLESSAGRLVMPLVVPAALPLEDHWLTPSVTVAGQRLIANPFDLATIPLARLGRPVASLADDESRAKLIRAIDELISQA
jgi:toxin CcdB